MKIDESKRKFALLNCQRISRAIEEYTNSPKNPGTTNIEKLPASPAHLAKPPFGGPPFLKDGYEGLVDPWGKVYQFQTYVRKDGSLYIIAGTVTPDLTLITQFGIGPSATPKD